MTGHLLLTTLHTNSAAGAVTRLLDMGLEPYLIASSVAAVFTQRLVRKICKDCKEAYNPTKAELDEASRKAGVTVPTGAIKFSRGKGCKSCRGSGYQGRQLLFEVLQQFPGFRQMILQKATFEDIQIAAIKAGMESLGGHGLTLVRAGETTLEELLRVVGARD